MRRVYLQSYYGEQKLYFMAADGSNESAVPLPKVGARWQPRVALLRQQTLADLGHSPACLASIAWLRAAVSALLPGRCVRPAAACAAAAPSRHCHALPHCLQEGPVHDVQWSPKGDYFVVGEYQPVA